MNTVWIVWKVELGDSYKLVSAHCNKEAAVAAGMKTCGCIPRWTATDSNGMWVANLGGGDSVMVQELPLENLVQP